jgi:hypothetical protein
VEYTNHTKDEVGNVYGCWSVIRFSHKVKTHAYWFVRCICGTERVLCGSNLRCGKSKSCGCNGKGRKPMDLYRDLIGQVFGRLTITGKVKPNPHSRSRKTKWICHCLCGNTCTSDAATLDYGKKISCGCYRSEVVRAKNINSRLPDGLAARNSVIGRYVRGAKKRGLAFEFTTEQVLQLMQQDCYYCGRKPETVARTHNANTGLFVYNGLDRRDNAVGYTKLNTVPCCKPCNFAKGRMTEEEFYDTTTRVYNHQNLKI